MVGINNIKKSLKHGILVFILFIFILMLFFSVGVYATGFDVEFKAVNNTIIFGQLAKFNLTITNELDGIVQFKVYTLHYPVWDLTTEPFSNPIQFPVMPHEKKEISLFLNPLEISTYGIYEVDIIVELINKKEKIKVPVRVNIVPLYANVYVETVLATILIDDNIDPTHEIPMKIMLNNQNLVEYPDLLVTIESKLINDEFRESLGKKEKKTISLTKNIPKNTPSQEDVIVVKLIANNKTLDTQLKRIKITEHEELVKEEQTRKRFLSVVKEITLKNIGNMHYTKNIKIESSFIQKLFTSSKPKGMFIKEEGKRYLSIPVNLASGESLTITVTQNYISLLIITLMMGIIILLYNFLKSPLVITKSTTNINFKEGGISELKVVLNIKNRSKHKLEGIEIIDKISLIVDLDEDLIIGTLNPTKILNLKEGGTIIKWFIDGLETGDERVVSYKVKSHLLIVGGFELTQAIAKFNFRGKEIIAHSNRVKVDLKL